MSIKFDHAKQSLGVTDQAKPLTIDAPAGILLKTTAAANTAGTLAYDTAQQKLKYYNGSAWVFVGSATDLSGKASKQNALDFGGAGASQTKYLTVNSSSIPIWRDPVDDGFVRFNVGSTVTIASSLVFNGSITLSASKTIDCAGNRVQNIIAGGTNDAVPRSYVDSSIQTASTEATTVLNQAYVTLVNRYQQLIYEIYNEPFPAAPTVDTPVIPPVVIPPPVIIQPPNPARQYNMHYGTRVLDPSDSTASIIGAFVKTEATRQNFDRNPASGSTMVCTYIKKVLVVLSKSGTIVNTAFMATFSYNGSTATLVTDVKL